jgi:hypothetical protein
MVSFEPGTSKNKYNIKVNKVHFEAITSYDSFNQDCIICHNLFEESCIGCPDKSTCKMVISECQHGYHNHCINKWLAKGHSACPFCNKPWKLKI